MGWCQIVQLQCDICSEVKDNIINNKVENSSTEDITLLHGVVYSGGRFECWDCLNKEHSDLYLDSEFILFNEYEQNRIIVKNRKQKI